MGGRKVAGAGSCDATDGKRAMLDRAVNALSAVVTALARVGYDAGKLKLMDDALANPPPGGETGVGGPLARVAECHLRAAAGVLRAFILFVLPILVFLALSLVLVDR